ncbi:TPA: hypothetical protein DD449_04335 [Candidatus Berkelbacteria bacterium]|uniref:Uncharacterized protein n=1 Tax=Berkelbacteria bacterium GW2011_GWE1_39_12 TaxID=1618337 RepID=A0A0G4B5L9_9BACT|nr:MAG: hypothetical protein UT28_C0001G0487 [Berkelbacteria bacterium GW2011_GWE1_39_12]HBO60883.1 hypothetical protein [Candidatus Berkelbacteria bacterium]
MNNHTNLQPDQDYDKNYNKRNEELLNELLDLPYDEIIKKYKKEDYFNDVFDRAIDGDVMLLGSLIADDFIPEEIQNGPAPKKLTKEQNEKIIEFIAEDQTGKPEPILKQIQTVLPEAKLPKDFDYADYHGRAGKVYNATLSLKAVLAEYDAFNYENDVKFFLKLIPDQINALLAEEAKISVKMQKEYEALLSKGTQPNPKVMDEAIIFMGRCGRTSMQLNTFKEKKNLGVITEIITKSERAMKITLEIKKKNTQINSDEDLLSAIATHLVEVIHL